MATIDTSLFPSATFKVDSGEAMPVTSRLNALRQSQLGDIQLQQAQQALEEENALRQAVKGLDLSTPEGQQAYGKALLNRGNVKAYQEFQAGLAAQTKAGHEAQTAKLQYDKAHHDEVNTLIGDVTRYTSADQAKSALDSLLEQGKIDTQTHGLYSGMIASTPWPQAKTQILGGLRSVQEQFESMQPTTQLGKLQNDLVAARARGDKEAEAQISDAIYKETHFAPQAKTTVNVNTADTAATAFSKGLGEKVSGELDTLNTKAQSAKSSLETSQLLRPLLENKDFISGTLGDTRLTVAKALGLSGADDTQTFFAGIGKQVAENVKAFGSGTSISDADRAYAEKIAGGSIQLTPASIKKIMDLNDKYSQLAIDKYNSRKKFLAQKNSTINDYYEDIVAPSTSAKKYADTDVDAALAKYK